MPPDPKMPGLLDLLTVRALGEPLAGGAVDAGGSGGDLRHRRSAAPQTVAGSQRLWVEVEV